MNTTALCRLHACHQRNRTKLRGQNQNRSRQAISVSQTECTALRQYASPCRPLRSPSPRRFISCGQGNSVQKYWLLLEFGPRTIPFGGTVGVAAMDQHDVGKPAANLVEAGLQFSGESQCLGFARMAASPTGEHDRCVLGQCRSVRVGHQRGERHAACSAAAAR